MVYTIRKEWLHRLTLLSSFQLTGKLVDVLSHPDLTIEMFNVGFRSRRSISVNRDIVYSYKDSHVQHGYLEAFLDYVG